MENTLLALELKSQLDQLRPINKEQESRIMQKFRLDWNYHSNHLEGNSLTYGETKALILFGITAQGKPLKDHFEITGHNDAINWVVDVVKGDFPLTEKFIRELHTLLLKESYEVDAVTLDGKPTKKRINVGSYKTSANHVLTETGEIFYFATPEETPAKMHDLMVWYNQKIKEVDKNPILIAAEFHYKFIRIHPFDDGNGRTARILMNFILMKFGYPPVIIKTEDKTNYFAVLQMADAGNIEAFLEYISQNLVRSLEIMIAGANGENIEEDDDLDKEIALLEQRLGDTYSKLENKNELLGRSFYDLVEKFITDISKFKILYDISDIYLKIDDEEFTLDKEMFLEKVITALKNDEFLDYIQLTFNFSGLKQEKTRDVKFSNKFRINFETNSSFYITTFLDELKIDKMYRNNLNFEEINKIVKSEVRRHKEFIELIIFEKENN